MRSSAAAKRFVALRMRRQPLAVAGFAFAGLLAFANYFLWQERDAISLREDEARRNGEFMLQALNGHTRIDADLAALREALAQIDGNLIDERGMEVNLGYFYRFEKAARVKLVRLNQLASVPPPAGARYKAVPFSLQLSGSYRNSLNFLRALETGPRLIRVRTCSFERAGDSNTELLIDLTIDVLAKT